MRWKDGVFVDHIQPVMGGVHNSPDNIDWNVVIKRMFVETEKLQVLCKECHTRKTKDERKKK